MSNIGKIIRDSYCNGYFGREYDLDGAEIIAEGLEFLVIRKVNGVVVFCSFHSYDYNRDENGNLTTGICNLTCLTEEERQELINNWCK